MTTPGPNGAGEHTAVQDAICRVSVRAPGRRVDVSLPLDMPVADLLPFLARLALVPAGQAGGSEIEAWRLFPLGGRPFPGQRTLRQCSVLDGDILMLERAGAVPAPPVVTDLTEVLERTVDHELPLFTKRLATTIVWGTAGAAGVAGAALLCIGPPTRPGLVVLPWAITAALFFAAWRLNSLSSQHTSRETARLACMLLAILYLAAGVGALAAIAHMAPTTRVVAGTVGALAACVVLLLLMTSPARDGDQPRVNLPQTSTSYGLLGLASTAGAMLLTGVVLTVTQTADARRASAALAVSEFLLLLALGGLPHLVLRRLSVIPPGLPSQRATTRAARVAARAIAAHRMLGALMAGLAAVLAALMVTVCLLSQTPLAEAYTLVAAGAVLGLTRRWRLRSEVLPLLGAAGLGIATAEITMLAATDSQLLRFAVVAATALFLAAVGRYGTGEPGYAATRSLDVITIVLVAALVPLMLGMFGAFDKVRESSSRLNAAASVAEMGLDPSGGQHPLE